MKYILLLSLCFFFILVQSQVSSPLEVGSFVIKLPQHPKEVKNIPGRIKVLDLRFDSTIGFINRNEKKAKMIMEAGVNTGIEKYFQDIPGKRKSDMEILMVIEKLWISDDLFAPYTNDNKKKLYSGIVFQFVFFFQSGDFYIPLYRFDSTIISALPLRKTRSILLAAVLDSSLEKLKSIDIEKKVSGKSGYALANIVEQYNHKFSIPLLTQTPRKGVFLSFEEFKNNSPSITSYTVKSDRKTDNIYIKDETGKETLIRNAYAMSDGKDYYVWSSDNLYKLYRSGNTFNFYGARGFYTSSQMTLGPAVSTGVAVGALLLAPYSNYYIYGGRSKALRRRMLYYQLDMETGLFL